MSQLMKSFGQHINIIERTKREEEEEEEGRRHAKAKHRAAKTHREVMSVGDKKGEEAETKRYKAEKKAEQGRHVRHHRSKYKKPGRRGSTHEEYETEAVGSVPGITSTEPFFTTSRRTKNRSPNAPPTSNLLKQAHDRIAKEKRLRKEKQASKEKAMNVLSPGSIERLKKPEKPSLVTRIKRKIQQGKWDSTVTKSRTLANEHDPDHGETLGETKDHDDYNKLMKKYGDMPTTKVPYSDFRRIEKLGTKLRGKTGTAARPKKSLKTVPTGLSDEYEIDEARMGVILRNVKKGTEPYTIVAHKTGRVIDQEHTKMAQAVPAFVREMQKKHRNAKISVEDRRGRVLHVEGVAVDKTTEADYKEIMAGQVKQLRKIHDAAWRVTQAKMKAKKKTLTAEYEMDEARRQFGVKKSKLNRPRHWAAGGREAGEAGRRAGTVGGAVTKSRTFGGGTPTSRTSSRPTSLSGIETQRERERLKKKRGLHIEANWMVDIDGIGKIVLDGKSSAEIKTKLRKMLRHKDNIGSVERMTDAAKKKYFRQKATGKEEAEYGPNGV